MALAKKKIVKKKLVKKAPVKKVVKKKPVATKKVVKKKPTVKKPLAGTKIKVQNKAKKIPTGNAKPGKGKYPYEPFRAKKNVGNCAKNACLQGKATDDVIEIVMEEFPECNISVASVGYYRSALRREGYDL